MKAFLMHRDRDFDWDRELPPNAGDLDQDLGLATLLSAMAGGDAFLFDVARRALLSGLRDPQEIVYRQQVLRDCIGHAPVVAEMYATAVEAIEGERQVYRAWMDYPAGILRRGVEVLQLFLGQLRKLRRIADAHAGEFRSPGFTALFDTLRTELSDDYLASVEEHLRKLKFQHGVLISARLGKGGKGVDYVLREPRQPRPVWREWFSFLDRSDLTLWIHPRDEQGPKYLSELRDRGLNLAANALAQSTDHILSFFRMLRAELGFYLGCLNLRQRLVERGEPICFPTPLAPDRPSLSCRGLYDVCLALRREGKVVGNDVDATGRSLVMITGPNQGGKSTFLRSVGLAQLMMQCGMFVGAEDFRASPAEVLFTHFRREEDVTMVSGKLDEELRRMREIADRLVPGGLVLFNESFAATNEREGAEIASAVVEALVEAGVRVFFVTHSYELAHRFHARCREEALFLRAERRADGERTFRMIEGEPLPTSYGEDLYRAIFGEDAEAAGAGPEV
jgi:DNA mismatch repair ATPase MutS